MNTKATEKRNTKNKEFIKYMYSELEAPYHNTGRRHNPEDHDMKHNRHENLKFRRRIQSTNPHTTIFLRSMPTNFHPHLNLCLVSGLFPWGSSTKIFCHALLTTCMRATCPTCLITALYHCLWWRRWADVEMMSRSTDRTRPSYFGNLQVY
jgi:hypothetical protein